MNKNSSLIINNKKLLIDSNSNILSTEKNNNNSINKEINYFSGIKEVYKDNFIYELKIISSLLDEYNYIGMDTEFPGTVYTSEKITKDFYFRTLKLNVDSLKLIQVGITLTNSKGEYPKNYPYHTWQFNFQFDLDKDIYSDKSVNLLINSGINFNLLKTKGIDHKDFAEYLMISGLILNPEIHWISFQGGYDFGYLLRLLLNKQLPKTEKEYINLLCLYFPYHYDIKILTRDNYFLHGSLNKLTQILKIDRKGIMHQAGSDSLVTIEVFHKLRSYGIISQIKINILKNIVYGIGLGEDNIKTINYTKSDTNKENENKNKCESKNTCKAKPQKLTYNSFSNVYYYCPVILVNTFNNIKSQ